MNRFLLLFCIILCGCQESMDSLTRRVVSRAEVQLSLLDDRMPSDSLPRTYDNGKFINSNIKYWCSGFFGGSLWYLYELSGNQAIKERAIKNSLKLAELVPVSDDHDLGFQINCTYGNAYRLTGDKAYADYMVEAAAKLSERYNPQVRAIRSWNSKAGQPYKVIIDNMMNLELLLKATGFSGDSLYYRISIAHADKTLENHFRPDNSCYHLICYDEQTGEAVEKCTVQGYADESAWARGQSWALYGYTMMYRLTGLSVYLEQALKTAEFIAANLPEDGIPYWDFDVPDKADALRDASAGAIMASAFIDLAQNIQDSSASEKYLNIAERQLRTLASEEYLAEPGTNGGFLLKHSVGHYPAGKEIDVPLTYTDYYFLEALQRWSELKN